MIEAQDLPIVIEQVLHRSSCNYPRLQLLFQEGGGEKTPRKAKEVLWEPGLCPGSALLREWVGGGSRELQGFSFATAWLCDLGQAI